MDESSKCEHELHLLFSVEALVYAMAPIERVLQTSTGGSGTSIDEFEQRPQHKQQHEQQDHLASVVQRAWDDPHGPSKTYLSHLIKTYVQRIGDQNIESELLMEALLKVLSSPGPRLGSLCPELDESCYLSFWLPKNLDNNDQTEIQQKQEQQPISPSSSPPPRPPLRLRVYPKHNDVALRLWEGGALLAEYLLANPQILAGRRVIELGSGVGATALVVASGCDIRGIYCTDFTDLCLENLRHNLQLNQVWLRRRHHHYHHHHHHHKEPPSWNPDNINDQEEDCKRGNNTAAFDFDDKDMIQCGRLDWTWFGNEMARDDGEAVQDGRRQLAMADILLAADVAYDRSILKSLVNTIYYFLTSYLPSASCQSTGHGKDGNNNNDDNNENDQSVQNNPKWALLATTRRNLETFQLLERELVQRGIKSKQQQWMDKFPHILFPCQFHQPRSDVLLTILTL